MRSGRYSKQVERSLYFRNCKYAQLPAKPPYDRVYFYLYTWYYIEWEGAAALSPEGPDELGVHF